MSVKRRIDFRQNPRIKEKLRIRWQSKSGEQSGAATLCDISASGMQIEARAIQPPLQNAALAFESPLNHAQNFIPKAGRVVWAQKIGFGNAYRLGIEFASPADETLARLRERMHAKIVHLVQRENIQNLVGVTLFAVSIVMAAYVLKEQQANYQNLETSNQLSLAAAGSQANIVRQYASLYSESEMMLTQLSGELKSAQAALTEAETFLSSIQQENFELQNQLLSLQMDMNLGRQVAALKVQNDQMEQEMDSLQDQLRIFSGQARTEQEGRALIAFYRDRIQMARGRIRDLRIAAGQERDRMLLLAGNQGVLSNGYYVPGGKMVQEPAPQKAINIDVSFF